MDAAISQLFRVKCKPTSVAIPTDNTRIDSRDAIINGHIKSFHDQLIVKMANAANAAPLRGTKTRQ
jgi:hypothetical protein